MGLKRQIVGIKICELLFGCKEKIGAEFFFW
jgi:hypothetical protein